MIRALPKTALLWILLAGMTRVEDRFSAMKQQLAEAACTQVEFVSIIESDIFDTADSAIGTAHIARDGRFSVELGDDRYLFDRVHLYSYSKENEQVVIEKVSDPEEVSREITFITRLDELYVSRAEQPGRSYRLTRRSAEQSNIPDSVQVLLARDSLRLERLEYLDVNEERNIIVIRSLKLQTSCDEQWFEPVFPDSVERVKL